MEFENIFLLIVSGLIMVYTISLLALEVTNICLSFKACISCRFILY